MTANISDLAPEILDLITRFIPSGQSSNYEYPDGVIEHHYLKPLRTVRHRDLANLRLTCRAFDRAVQPVLFSEISVDCMYARTSIVRSQLSSLAGAQEGPWTRHTKKLNIITLDPYFDRRPIRGSRERWRYEEKDLTAAQQELGKEMKEIVASTLLKALKSLPLIHTLNWFVHGSDPMNELAAHLGRLQTLKNLSLVFWNADILALDYPLDAFSNLTHLQVGFYLEADAGPESYGRPTYRSTAIDTAQLSHRWSRLLESSPELVSLRIDSDQDYTDHPSWRTGHPVPVKTLTSSPACRHLTHLVMGNINPPDPLVIYRQLCANLTSLISVELMHCEESNAIAFWSAVFDSKLFLSSIKIDLVTPELESYLLRPDVPLESFSFDGRYFQIVDFREVLFTKVLEIHAKTLRVLDIPATLHPWYEVEIDDDVDSVGYAQDTPAMRWSKTSIPLCTELRSLGLNIDLRSTVAGERMDPGRLIAQHGPTESRSLAAQKIAKFLRALSCLPNLRVVNVHSSWDLNTSNAIHEMLRHARISKADNGLRCDVEFEEAVYHPTPPPPDAPDGSPWRYVNIAEGFEIEDLHLCSSLGRV